MTPWPTRDARVRTNSGRAPIEVQVPRQEALVGKLPTVACRAQVLTAKELGIGSLTEDNHL